LNDLIHRDRIKENGSDMTLAVDTYNFIGSEGRIKRGINYAIAIVISSNGNVISLQGLTGFCKVKKYYDSPTAICEPEIKIIDAVNGLIHLVIDGETTKNIRPSIYKYDIFFVNELGEYSSFLEGEIEFSYSVSI
jgi:hypothetical protein